MAQHSKTDLLQLQLCQQDIVKVDIAVKKHIDDIKRQTFASQKEIADCTRAIKDEIAILNRRIDVLEKFTSKVTSLDDRAELSAQINEHRKECERNRQLLRQALLLAMKAMDERSRDFLFNDRNTPEEIELRNRKKRATDMKSESLKATESLASLVSRMSDQLKLSEETSSVLIHSSAVIKETESEFSTMGAHIQSGGKLISKYGRRECTDKVLIALALLLYVAVVFYILRKRVLSVFY